MSLTQEDVRRIAELARLEIGAAESETMLDQLNQVFNLIETLKSVDTAGVEPMTHAQDLVLRLREDRVTETDHRDDYQQPAPAVEQGLYLVPKVLE